MTLPASGLISTNDINVELGRSASTPMSLDDADVRALAGIPSGPISLSDFYGKSSVAVRNPLNDSVSGFGVSGTVTARLTYNPDGTCSVTGSGGSGSWITPTAVGIGSGYWFKWTLQSGSTPSGPPQNQWVQLSSSVALSVARSTNGTTSGAYNVFVATAASDSAIVATGNLFLSVERGA